MELSPVLLSRLLLYSFLFGLFLGMLNDAFRITRVFLGVKYSKKEFKWINSLFKHDAKESEQKAKSIRIVALVTYFIEDIFLLLAGAFGTVVLCYYLDNGNIRSFVVVSIVCGAILWYMSFGKIIIAFSEPIAIFVKFIVVFICKFLTFPLLFLCTLSARTCKFFYLKSKKGIANFRNLVYNVQLRMYYTKNSYSGFLDDKRLKGNRTYDEVKSR